MRTTDVDILMVPGWLGSGPDHWQTRWERKLTTARRIEQPDWDRPDRDTWVGNIIAAAAAARLPPVFVAHGLGAIAVAHAAAKLPAGTVAGAFLVAPADVEEAQSWPKVDGHIWPADGDAGFAPVPLTALPFPASLLASSDDPHCRLARARHFAAAWGARFVEVGPAGHITPPSGHGPWPDGALRLGGFLKGLTP